MSDSSTIGVLVLVLLATGVFATVGLAAIAWRRRETPGARTFLVFLCGAVVYSCATIATMLAPSDGFATGAYYVASVGGVTVGVAWVGFVVEYTGYWERMQWWSHVLLWGQPAVYSVGLLTNPWHGAILDTEVTGYGFLTLIEPTYGPIARFEIVYILVLVLVSFGLLGHLYLRTRNVHRKQTGAIILGALLPTAAYSLFWTELTPHPAMDITPVAFVLQATVVGWALFRYDFLSVSPVATELYIQRMADPLLVLDERDRLVDYNDSAAAVLGVDTSSNRPHVRAIDPRLAAALDDAGTVELSTDEGLATFDLTETVIRDRHGRVRGSMILLRDVTELEEQRAELQRTNAQLEQFSSVVSHDLRNPLNVARGFAELARDDGNFAALDRSISAMEDMEALIHDLLTLARKGETVDEVELVSFLDVVEGAWAETPTDGATLEVADDADFECYADRERFQELLGNLFRNAVEHGSTSPRSTASSGDEVEHGSTNPRSDEPREDAVEHGPGDRTWTGEAGRDESSVGTGSTGASEPALTVTVGRLDDRSGFYVEDDGVGIPESTGDEVFESGYSTGGGGTGLGLSIVESVANGHGWDVALDESERGGARFEFAGLATPGSG